MHLRVYMIFLLVSCVSRSKMLLVVLTRICSGNDRGRMLKILSFLDLRC